MVGSLVGVQKYVYDIFGPGINLAARMEAQADAMEILLCEEMRRRLSPLFEVEEIGLREIRGFGEKRLFRLLASDEISLHD